MTAVVWQRLKKGLFVLGSKRNLDCVTDPRPPPNTYFRHSKQNSPMDGQFLQLLLLPVLRTCLTVALSPALELILGRVCVCVCVLSRAVNACMHKHYAALMSRPQGCSMFGVDREGLCLCVCVCVHCREEINALHTHAHTHTLPPSFL